MKSYTNIPQSKKLAEFLPIDSADMFYTSLNRDYPWIWIDKHLMEVDDIPCWSLTALLNIMPDRIDDSHFLTLDKEGKEYCCCYEDINGNSFKHEFADNAIGACYEMILELKENNLL